MNSSSPPARAFERLRGLTTERVLRSLRFRAMNNLARFDIVRDASALGFRRHKPVRSNLFPDANVDRHVSELRREGITRGLALPDALRDEIRSWLESTPCYGNHCKDWGYLPAHREEAQRKVQKTFTLGSYYNLQDCEAIRRLSEDALVREIALRYVGPRAQFLHAIAWWSYPSPSTERERNEFAQQYHFDLDDYRFVKFFFYLTDVDGEAGPHVYVRGTQRGKKLRHLYPMRRLSDSEVESTYGAHRVDEVHGAAGTGFVVDTFGLHKGLPPRSRERLVLQLEFGRHNWVQGITDPPRDQLKIL